MFENFIFVIGGSTEEKATVRNMSTGTSCVELCEVPFSRAVHTFDIRTNSWSTSSKKKYAEEDYYDSESGSGYDSAGGGPGFDGGSETEIMPGMHAGRSEFGLVQTPVGVLVVGGTNRYLYPNRPLSAEFLRFSTMRWECLEDLEAENEYDGWRQHVHFERIGCSATSVNDGRFAVVCGGMHLEPFADPSQRAYFARMGEDDDDDDDFEYDSQSSGDEGPGEGGGEYGLLYRAPDDRRRPLRLQRVHEVATIDLQPALKGDTPRWTTEFWANPNCRGSFSRGVTGTNCFGLGGCVLHFGGDMEFYGENGMYPSHGTFGGSIERHILRESGKICKGTPTYRGRNKKQMMPNSVACAAMARFPQGCLKLGVEAWPLARSLRKGQAVVLHGLRAAQYNGQRGVIEGWRSNGQRWAVTFLEGEKKKELAIRAANILAILPGDDVQELVVQAAAKNLGRDNS
jgi:hypothetical protein